MMSSMDKALQVGTLAIVSVGIFACAPQKNANVLPSKITEKTFVAKVSLPTEAAVLAAPNLVQTTEAVVAITPNSVQSEEAVAVTPPIIVGPTQTDTIIVVQNAKPPEDNIVQPVALSSKVTQAAPSVEQQKQKTEYTFYGTPDQPGYQIQSAIFALFEQGVPLEQAAQQVIDLAISQNQIIRDALAMAAIAEQPNLSVQFVLDIAQLKALIDASKRTMENNPGQLTSIISLGVSLYPDFTRDFITAAALTGEMTEEDAILLAIAAGADPTLLASSTAAGSDGPGLSAFAAAPLGSGIGAGGTGGGDTTASTN